MGATALSLELEICDEDGPCAAAGSCHPQRIRVAQQPLHDPQAVAATLAHALASTLLPPALRAERSEHENAWLTDLVSVFLGLGVIMANAALHEAADQEAHVRRRLLRRQGFLPARMVGYAMALFTWVRGEAQPPWRSALRLDALAAYTGGLRYVERTADSVFTYASASRPYHPIPTQELVRQLATGSPSARVVALWDLREPQHAGQAADAVMQCLHDRRPAIRQEAAATLGCYGEHARSAITHLVDLLQDDQHLVRSAAATALGILGHEIEVVLPPLIELLGDPDRTVVASAAMAVQNFGMRGLPAAPALLAALKSALIRCDHGLTDVVSRTLFAIERDPTDRVMQFFADDYELREQFMHLLVDAARPPEEHPTA
jgi:hypothetical protein